MPAGVNMRATSIVDSEGSTAAELLVVDGDPRVDHIRIRALTGGGVVDVLAGGRLAMGNAAETPFCT